MPIGAPEENGRCSATLGELVEADGGLRLVGHPGLVVTGISYDVREVGAGDLFAALDGADFRGHDFAVEAVARGATALLVERPVAVGVPYLVADKAGPALARVAAAFHGHPSRELSAIGITGTDGKTTTSHMADAILRASGLATGCVTTIGVRLLGALTRSGTRLTTPESPDVQALLHEMVDVNATWAVLEATSHGLALNRLDEVDFAVGAVTNVTLEHLDFHGTPDGYRRAKGMLFERVARAGGVVVVNADDDGALELLPHADGARILFYGLEGSGADIVAAGLELRAGASRFVVVMPDGERVPVELSLPGTFNVSNALCAAACAAAVGVPASAVAEGLEGLEPLPGRMQRILAGQPFEVVVDFAHTPAALGSVLALLRRSHPDGHLITVIGSAGERDRVKRPLLGEVAATASDQTVFTSEDPRYEDPDAIIAQLAAGAVRAGGQEGTTFTRVTDRTEAIRLALGLARPGDCVLLAGKGHERSIVWGAEEHPWDEAETARELLAELGYDAG